MVFAYRLNKLKLFAFFYFLIFFLSFYLLLIATTVSDEATYLEIDIISEKEQVFQVFWKNDEDRYSEKRSRSFTIKPGENKYRVKLPAYITYDSLRIDPLNRSGVIFLERFSLESEEHKILSISDYPELNRHIVYCSGVKIEQDTSGTMKLSCSGDDPLFEIDTLSFFEVLIEYKIQLFIALLSSAITMIAFYRLMFGKYSGRAHKFYPKTGRGTFLWLISSLFSAFFLMVAYPFRSPEYIGLCGYFAFAVVAGTWVFIVSLFLVTRPEPARNSRSDGRFTWLLYSLPAFAVFSFYLLAFWPGAMSPDSLDQWKQVVRFSFKDWHPAFHSMNIWLVTRIWEAPITVSFFQIGILSVSFGWVMSRLQALGVSKSVLFICCILFACLPVNGLMSITLWKDIPYSVAMAVVALLLLEISINPNTWFNSTKNIFMLSLFLLLVSLYRHNGIIPAFGVPAILFIVYFRHWKKVVTISSIVICSYMLIKGPLYNWMDVERGNPLDHVYSKIGNKFSALSLLPHKKKEEGAGKTQVPDDHLPEKAAKNSPGRFDMPDRLKASSLLWRIKPLKGFYKRVDFVNLWGQWKSEGLRIRYISGNGFGFQEAPILPEMTKKIFRFFEVSKNHPFLSLMWRPALFLYIFIGAAIVASLRNRKLLLLTLLPVLLNSLPTLLFVIHKSIFRYHYSIVITSLLLSLPLLTTRFNNDSGSIDQHSSVKS